MVLTLGCMYAAMRMAGPVTRGYNLGTLSYEVQPSLNGRAELVIPHTGVRLEAKALDAPYVLRVKPRSLSVKGLAEAAVGVRSAVHTAKNDIVRGVIWAFVRALVYALVGGLIGAALSATLVFVFGRLGRALLAGVIGVVLAVAGVGASGLWVWQAHYIRALEHPTVIAGERAQKLNLAPLLRRIRHARDFEEVIRDLSSVLVQVARG